VLLLAFIPGRDVPLPAAGDLAHRIVHSGLSPVVLGGLLVVTVVLALRRPARPAVTTRGAALRDWAG